MEPSLTIVEGFTAVGLAAVETVFFTAAAAGFFSILFVPAEGAAEGLIFFICDMMTGTSISARAGRSVLPARDFRAEDPSSACLVNFSSSFCFLLSAAVLWADLLSEDDCVSLLLLDRDRRSPLSLHGDSDSLSWPLGGV